MQSRVVSEEQRRITAYRQTQPQAQQSFQNSLNMLNENLQRQQDRAALMAPQPITPVTWRQMGTSCAVIKHMSSIADDSIVKHRSTWGRIKTVGSLFMIASDGRVISLSKS